MLRKFENLYHGFDGAHDTEHMLRVRETAVSLARTHLPGWEWLAYVAATLHDIGLSASREDHEHVGAQIVLEDDLLRSYLTEAALEEVAHAVREHRASVGKPKTVLAKIVSDADRCSSDTSYTLYRSIRYSVEHTTHLVLEEHLENSLQHHVKKFAPGCYGRRHYFKETGEKLSEIFDPIVSLPDSSGIWDLMNAEHQTQILAALSRNANA